MTHASLFTGLGGFDIAAQWCGWSNIFQCEINDFCRTILKYHFPKTELYADIETTDFTKHRDTIDVLSGGFPCQPFSIAGKRKGTTDDRFLWHQMFRAIQEVQPSWVVAENVYGLITQERGLVFERMCTGLEIEGYDVQPFIIPACAVGAPHKRSRVWIIAHRADTGIESVQRSGQNSVCKFGISANTERDRRKTRGTVSNIEEQNESKRANVFRNSERLSKERTTPNANSIGSEKSVNKCETVEFTQNIPSFRNFPTQSPICSGNDGLSHRLHGITFPAWRRKSLEAYGNAIVPQVAYEIFKTIEQTYKS